MILKIKEGLETVRENGDLPRCVYESLERVISDIKEYKITSKNILEYKTFHNDKEPEVVSLSDYSVTDFSASDNPNEIIHRVENVYVMNENGVTIERLI